MDVATQNGHAPSFAIFPTHSIANGRCTCGKDCQSPGKHPLESLVPHGCKDATTDPEIQAQWWSRFPDANLAINTDNLVVVDIDPKHGGLESLRELEGEYGETLPRTVTVNTGGGGFHYYMQRPTGNDIHCRNGWRPGIDIKSKGGYVVAPPSKHIEGVYEWAKGKSPTDVAIAPVPDWLLPLLPQKTERVETPRVNGHTPRNIDNLQRAQAYVAAAAAANEGNRNDAAFRLAGHVRGFDLGETEIVSLLTTWNYRNNPPLTEQELLQCVRSALVNGTPRAPKEDRPGMKDLRAAEYRDEPETHERKEITYEVITSAGLATGDYSIEFAIEGAMVAGQPLEIGGPMKALKTSILIDGAISLASGGFFLGRFKVNKPRRVLVMSGESGLGTIQETANRISAAANLNLADLSNLIWSPDLPKFGSADHMESLEKLLRDEGVEILFLDPAYLAMPSADAGNLMAQGELLRNWIEVCQPLGITPVICHHSKRNTGRDPYEPLELQDLAWAGHAEFARQWWLVNRRERYEPGTGEHRLWLSLGGSAGHSSLWAVDVSEGKIDDVGGRRWGLDINDAAGARVAADERKKQAKHQGNAERLEGDRKAICEVMAGMPEHTGTKTEVRNAAGFGGGRFEPAFASLIRDKVIEPTTTTKGNNRSYDAYKLRASE